MVDSEETELPVGLLRAVRKMSSEEQSWGPGRNWLPRRREMTKCIKDNRKIK